MGRSEELYDLFFKIAKNGILRNEKCALVCKSVKFEGLRSGGRSRCGD